MDELQELKLKYQGLLERVGTLSSRYEDEIAGFRTKATIVVQAYEELQQKYKELEERLNEPVQEEAAVIEAEIIEDN